LLFTVSLIWGCQSDYAPRPRGYFRIDLPEKEYISLSPGFNFGFNYPAYGEIREYTGSLEKEKNTESWLNIDFPVINARLYLTYKPVKANLGSLIEDAHTFVYKHISRADAIVQNQFVSPEKSVYGVLFDIKGNAASSLQFYLTDSTSGFLRGAFYFDCQPNRDSLAPLIEFIREDIEVLIQSFYWK